MRVSVAGAGIAGLTSAIALARRGFAVDIFEQAASLKESGAGIQLSPNAVAVLRRLGALEDLEDCLVEPDAIEMRDALSGRLLAAIPVGQTFRRRYGAPYFLVHRADLQAGLLAACRRTAGIALHLGCELHAPRDARHGVAFTAGGNERYADVLVAADGVNSRLRTQFFGHPGAGPLGRTAWRATIPSDDVHSSINRRVTGLWMGPRAHVVHYPVAGGKRINIVVIAADRWAGPLPPETPFGEDARRLFGAVQSWSGYTLSAVDPAPSWVRGRAVLLGDAAHAMAPSAAQGGAQAIEDAWMLAAALADGGSDVDAALRAYEGSRRQRVQRIARAARRNMSLFEMHGFPAVARNIALRISPARLLLSRLDWVFDWRPR